MADGPPAPSIVRPHYALACHHRRRAGDLHGCRAVAHDRGVSDDRWPSGSLFPRWIAARSLPTRHLRVIVPHAITALRFLEKAVHPRWPTPIEATKRVVGIAVIILSARLLLVPIPLSNVVPAFVIALISLAYLEEDGLVLAIALFAGFMVLAIDAGAVREMVRGAKSIGGLSFS